ncbi:MAG: S8 family serine peptidase [Acidobacteriota bacterium]
MKYVSKWSGVSGAALGFIGGLMILLASSHVTAQRSAVNPIGKAVPRACFSAGNQTVTQADPNPAPPPTTHAQGTAYVTGEVLIKFKAGMSPARRQRALGALRSRPAMTELQWTGDIARFRDPAEPDAERLASQLAEQPEVEFAQPNYIRSFPIGKAFAVAPLAVGPGVAGKPNDPDYNVLQWNLSLLNMPAAWDINAGGDPSIIVAVVDTGVTTEDTTLAGRLWTGQQFQNVALRIARSPDLSASRLVLPRDLIFNVGASSTWDFVGHGTHVASTIAEDANNQVSLAGMAYNVRIMPVKVCVGYWELMLARAQSNITGFLPSDSGGCSDSLISQGIRYAADNGARVINLSLGGVGEAPVVRDALTYAVGKGAFVAISAGNRFEDGNEPEFPAAYAPGIDGVMSVGAIGKSKTRAYYSDTGSQVEISAPGGSDRDGGGEDRGFVWQVTLYPPDADPLQLSVPRFDRYVEVGYTGTSMAAPHVSALAALLMSQGITTPQAVEAAIKAFALDLGVAGRDDDYGFGLIQPRASLFGLGGRR